MKNKPLLILSGIAIVLVISVIVGGRKNHITIEAESKTENNNFHQASANTYNDNLRAVSAKLDKVTKYNKQLEKKIDEVKNEKGKTSSPSVRLAQENQLLKRQMQSLKEDIDKLKSQNPLSSVRKGNDKVGGKKSYIIDSDLNPLNAKAQFVVDVDKLSSKGSVLSNPHLEKINPGTYIEKSKSATSQEFGNKKSKGIPYYTLPAGSDLAGMNLLSALIGEVPLGGKIEQPLFPFSAMVGRGALMSANGVPLPSDIKGMKVGGYAIGVGSFLDNISCTRAYVTSALFVFQDGHFETVGEEKMHSASQMVDEKAIGYMTDEYGNPCIHGTYFTNAPRVLAAMSGAAGVAGAGNALSQWQMSYFANGNGGAALPTGSIGKYALGGAVSQGSVKVSEWLEERVKGSFDMVFVPASQPYRVGKQTIFRPTRLTLHLTKTIEINKNMQGRRISYGHNQNGIHDYSLK